MNTNHDCVKITEKAVRAYFNCVRKSYLLMFERASSKPTDYETVLEYRNERARANYVASQSNQTFLNIDELSSRPDSKGPGIIADTSIFNNLLSTETALFRVIKEKSDAEVIYYEPITFAASYILRPEHKMEIAFAGHVLSQIRSAPILKGKVILLNKIEKTVRLPDSLKDALPAINALSEWQASRSEAPTVLLNKHCPYCEFQHICKPIAEKEDHISLLGGIGEKELRRYGKKGIFTVKQLSFLYRPRKRNRRLRPHPPVHKYELQALALRTGNIYLHGELTEIPHAETEIFVDIESIPEDSFHYLIGLVISTSEGLNSYQFWADCEADEKSVWNDFVALISKYPTSPLFHYGSFERKAIQKLAKLYGTPVNPILGRLFNVNTCIFGKIYFPVRSNSLKDICRFIGLSWSSPDASGLQSVVWRYRYGDTGDQKYQHLLLTYNYEDCENLRRLTERLRDIVANGARSSDVRFADVEGGSLTA